MGPDWRKPRMKDRSHKHSTSTPDSTKETLLKERVQSRFDDEGIDDKYVQPVIDFLNEQNLDLDDVSFTDRDDYVNLEEGKREYMVFATQEEAEEFATKQVKEDLENNPENFTQSWLESFMSITDTDKSIIANDEVDARLDGMDEEDLAREAGLEDELEEKTDAVDTLENEIDDLQSDIDDFDADGDQAELNSIKSELQAKKSALEQAQKELNEFKSELYDKASEALHDDIEKGLEDPIKYFVEDHGMFSREDLLKQSFIRIDVEEAAKDAIEIDGVAHFLATYDGDEIDLDGGGVAFRTN